MKFVLEMSAVRSCAAKECGYNVSGSCHAKAITVGDGVHPGCDTYLRNSHHTSQPPTAGVGACKVEACRHNRDLECTAASIDVDREPSGARCMTYDSR